MNKGILSSDVSLELKALIFHMHMAGYSQNAIASYLGKGNSTINEIMKPLQKGKKNESK